MRPQNKPEVALNLRLGKFNKGIVMNSSHSFDSDLRSDRRPDYQSIS